MWTSADTCEYIVAPTVTLEGLATATQMASRTVAATVLRLTATLAAEATVQGGEALVVLGVTRCLT